MSMYSLSVGYDEMTVELGMPEHPILVDGQEIGFQCAHASCRIDRAMRLVVGKFYGPIAETAEERTCPEQIAWDEDVAYEPVEIEAEAA